jgi:hypothetical protein
MYRVEIREFKNGLFGERVVIGELESLDLGDFEDLVDVHVPPGVEMENERARPWEGIVAARRWTIPADADNEDREFSAFLVELPYVFE